MIKSISLASAFHHSIHFHDRSSNLLIHNLLNTGDNTQGVITSSTNDFTKSHTLVAIIRPNATHIMLYCMINCINCSKNDVLFSIWKKL